MSTRFVSCGLVFLGRLFQTAAESERIPQCWEKHRKHLTCTRGLGGMSEHIPIERAWVLIEDGSALSTKEAQHLEKCRDCREFLQSFVSVARYIGLSVKFPTRRPADREGAA